MPSFKEMLPKTAEKGSACQACGKVTPLMNYKDKDGKILSVCSNVCLLALSPDHPVLDTLPSGWKEIQSLRKQRDEIDNQISALEKRKE
jgi:hypothetical protein